MTAGVSVGAAGAGTTAGVSTTGADAAGAVSLLSSEQAANRATENEAKIARDKRVFFISFLLIKPAGALGRPLLQLILTSST